MHAFFCLIKKTGLSTRPQGKAVLEQPRHAGFVFDVRFVVMPWNLLDPEDEILAKRPSGLCLGRPVSEPRGGCRSMAVWPFLRRVW